MQCPFALVLPSGGKKKRSQSLAAWRPVRALQARVQKASRGGRNDVCAVRLHQPCRPALEGRMWVTSNQSLISLVTGQYCTRTKAIRAMTGMPEKTLQIPLGPLPKRRSRHGKLGGRDLGISARAASSDGGFPLGWKSVFEFWRSIGVLLPSRSYRAGRSIAHWRPLPGSSLNLF